MSDFPDSTHLEGQGQEALSFEPNDLLPPSKHRPCLACRWKQRILEAAQISDQHIISLFPSPK
jgi:hypothetical protein